MAAKKTRADIHVKYRVNPNRMTQDELLERCEHLEAKHDEDTMRLESLNKQAFTWDGHRTELYGQLDTERYNGSCERKKKECWFAAFLVAAVALVALVTTLAL